MLYARLFWRMLRYRVAVMLVLFLLLGAASGGQVAPHAAQLFLAAIALAVSYVCATTSNDLADEKIDAINHAGHHGRPLVSGQATRRQMWNLFFAAVAIALALAAAIGPLALALMALSVAVNVAYSLPPLRLSYRTWLAPLILAVGYVGIPFALGASITGQPAATWRLAAALYFLFLGRIVLKDFRDRAGDAKYGKPTLLLVHGKKATVAASCAMVVIGAIWLLAAHPLQPGWQLLFPAMMLALALYQSRRLLRASRAAEQAVIGTGAKLGNGALIILLGLMLMQQSGAGLLVQTAFAVSLLGLYCYGYVQLIRSPGLAVNAYRG